ncbi:MAG: TetR/AcrR family transcriptional regulator [Mycobacterium sp.]
MAERLASGRHHLTRDEVAANQKSRLLQALAEVMGKNGYSNTTVDDLIKHAKVSRSTFYQHFDSKQDCFMAGYERMQGLVIEFILTAPEAGTPMQRFATMLHKYLGFVASDPATARLYLLEVYAAGPEAMRRRLALQQDFVDGVARVFQARTKSDRFACQALVGSISTLVTHGLAADDAASILALEKPILGFAARALGADAA